MKKHLIKEMLGGCGRLFSLYQTIRDMLLYSKLDGQYKLLSISRQILSENTKYLEIYKSVPP